MIYGSDPCWQVDMSKLDADGDGQISKEELEKALVELAMLGLVAVQVIFVVDALRYRQTWLNDLLQVERNLETTSSTIQS